MSNHTGEIEIEKLITAVKTGEEDKVCQFLSAFQEEDRILSAILPWDEGYELLRMSLKEKRQNIAKLLLNHGVEVTKISSRQTHNSPLYWAVFNEDLEIFKMIMAKGANVNFKNPAGKTPLFVAVEKNNKKLVRLILAQKNVMVNSTNSSVPLEAAAKVNNQKLFNLLLRHGASAKTSYSDGKTMLQIAVERGYFTTVESILKKYSDLHLNDENKNLLAAALIGHDEKFTIIVNLLVNYGFTVHPDYKDNDKLLTGSVRHKNYKLTKNLLKIGTDVNNFSDESPLLLACKRGLKKFVKLLIKYGANLEIKDNYNNNTPLHTAVWKSNVEITKLLLDSKASIDESILHIAVKNGSTDIVKLLLDYGAKVDGVDSCGRTALHQVAWMTEWNTTKESVEIAELLLRKGADLHAKCQTGETPLEYAVNNEKCQILKVFINRLENVNAPYIKYQTLPLLHYACLNGKPSSIRAIISCKANVNQPAGISLRTPLHYAVNSNVACEILLNNNADVNAKDSAGRTALHNCILQEAGVDVIETLLKNNADVDAIDDNGLTPFIVASQRNYSNCIDILLKYQANINSVSKTGKTALHYLIEYRNQDGIEKLLNYDFDIEKKSHCGYNSLQFAFGVARHYINYNNNNGIQRQFLITQIERRIQQCKNVIVLIQNHIIKMVSVRFFMKIEELDWNEIFKEKLKISVKDKNRITIICYFREMCKKELMLMQKVKIGSSGITFYYLLKKSIHQIARYAENQSIRQVFEYNFPESIFPIYKEIIKIRFQMALYRKSILDKDVESSIYVYFKGLPYNCCEEIFDYLDNQSLSNLITASQVTEKLHESKVSKNKDVGHLAKKRRKF